MFERPTTVTRLPLTDTPDRSSISITPDGVQGNAGESRPLRWKRRACDPVSFSTPVDLLETLMDKRGGKQTEPPTGSTGGLNDP